MESAEVCLVTKHLALAPEEVDGVKHRRSFRTVEEAHEWVIATRKELHGAFAVDLPKNTLGKRKTLLSN